MAHVSVTLLLNATYEPLCVVSCRRAVVLVLTEKAVPVQDGDGNVVNHAAKYGRNLCQCVNPATGGGFLSSA